MWTHRTRRTVTGVVTGRKNSVPEASCSVVEDLSLRRRKLAVRLSLGQGDEDLLRQLRERLSGQLLLQVVLGRKIPQDTCAGRQTAESINSTIDLFKKPGNHSVFPNVGNIKTLR